MPRSNPLALGSSGRKRYGWSRRPGAPLPRSRGSWGRLRDAERVGEVGAAPGEPDFAGRNRREATIG